MRIVIAGAGIGGLTTALSLHAAGFEDVTVHEAAPEIRPLGVGINLLPHAVRELTELGLADRLARIGVATAELAYFNRYGTLIWSEPRGLAAGYAWPQYSVHRGRLQMMLLDAVIERLGPDAVRTGSRITGPGDEDLLIGADGIHSAVRAHFYPDEGPPPWNGLVLWRGITYGEPFLTGRSMIMAGDGTQKFVAYPIEIGERTLINWIAERPLDGEAPDRGNWNRPADLAEIGRHFADWRFDWLDVPGIIAGAEAAYEYPMVDRDPLPRWTFDRVTLLGDAAHAMYPIGSNGASQAIIDARVLAYFLARGDLAAYEETRRPATTALQLSNRQMGPEIVMKLAHERAPDGFDDIEQVIPHAELAEIAASYKRTAGFDPVSLNSRPSWNVDRSVAS
ncbi:flavin-dependent oxidoreductase [Microbispora rosea subsp. aerata]|nr:flavin-dependent oxidoreductase [Microbispora rosea]GGO21870.1 flavin-dependent oxidoreductase [Microbispora rosea subsp. aerata]GIH53799.1 flavin-dependent oxidoreductase [Microbispora rosea subsp. aerata]GLJ81793.1 flavin-dependent oxidoreductase [Microbispora rosea subsp. aerata]